MLIRIIVAAVLMVILYFIPVQRYVRFILYLIPYLIVGYDILRKAFKGIINRQVFDENFLMAVVLSDRRTVPKLRCRKKPPQYQRPDGYSAGLRQY